MHVGTDFLVLVHTLCSVVRRPLCTSISTALASFTPSCVSSTSFLMQASGVSSVSMRSVAFRVDSKKSVKKLDKAIRMIFTCKNIYINHNKDAAKKVGSLDCDSNTLKSVHPSLPSKV